MTLIEPEGANADRLFSSLVSCGYFWVSLASVNYRRHIATGF
jgi:hypothetical protein